jgi:nitroimidazol reductase NimA-like FMN-containing flavoprotein (pyridoxamine 5'-phosphate oxidase superfamily)
VSNRRAQIAMTEEEAAAFLRSEQVVTCATLGRDGWPHLMPLWYVVRDGELWSWTYAKSQKVRNLERDRRCTLQVETGDMYDELRGVMIKAEAVIHREDVLELGVEILQRYMGLPIEPEALRGQAAKRVGLQFVRRRMASWDHRKLAGTY